MFNEILILTSLFYFFNLNLFLFLLFPLFIFFKSIDYFVNNIIKSDDFISNDMEKEENESIYKYNTIDDSMKAYNESFFNKSISETLSKFGIYINSPVEKNPLENVMIILIYHCLFTLWISLLFNYNYLINTNCGYFLVFLKYKYENNIMNNLYKCCKYISFPIEWLYYKSEIVNFPKLSDTINNCIFLILAKIRNYMLNLNCSKKTKQRITQEVTLKVSKHMMAMMLESLNNKQ